MVFRKSAIEPAVPAKHKTKREHQPEALPKQQFDNIIVQWPITNAEIGFVLGKSIQKQNG